MSQVLSKPNILPVISSTSTAFKHGYDFAQSGQYRNWPIQHAVREATLVQVLLMVNELISDDGSEDDQDTAAWCAGLLAGWLRRGV